MVTAIVLMQVARDQINAVASQLVEIDGVSEVFSVAGQHDLVVMIRVATNEQLAEVVTEKLRALDGILNTETLIAFKAFSKHDLERLFSIGLE
jgi:DNA-binding Lrp family transcriptional regulator